ncbi:hypothetical protein KQI84_00815 [bacterium]|nr:hypothetical protein [bacterium]
MARKKTRSIRRITAGCVAAALLAAIPATASARVILQWFESQWYTMERKMPDAFMTGYGAIWTPPIAKADSGAYSVGFDVYNRFDLGSPDSPTLYGTEAKFDAFVDEAHRAGVLVFADTVFNHNGFRDLRTPGFEAAGDYPGFMLSYGGDADGDFHNASSDGPSCETDAWQCRLAGLIDIAQEKNHQVVRQPAEAGANNIPNEPIDVNNRRFYPDVDPDPSDVLTYSGFNLTNPLSGDPYAENATGLLLRYAQWLVEVKGVDGFRLDAVKHTPDWFFKSFYDAWVYNNGTDFWGDRVTPFSFGENVTSDWGALATYVCKNGTGNCDTGAAPAGNRDALDFALYFTMKSVIGTDNFPQILDSSFDGYDGSATDGTLGVQFVQSHDGGGLGDPPYLSNMAYQYTLSRPGFPTVYFNAEEFGTGRDFPSDGRGDALGGRYGNTITKMLELHNDYIAGRTNNPFSERYRSVDMVAYERENSAIILLSDRGDAGHDAYWVEVLSSEFRDRWLQEQTGNAADPFVDPYDDIPEWIYVPTNGWVEFKVPRNLNWDNQEHGRPYLFYSLPRPEATLTVTNKSSTLPADPDTPDNNGTQRLTEVDVVTSDTAVLVLQTAQPDGTNFPPAEDHAMLRWNNNVDVNSNPGLDFAGNAPNTSDNILRGYEDFDNASPRASGGTGTFTQAVDLDREGIIEGLNYVSAVAFLPRPSWAPTTYRTVRKVIYVDRVPPPMGLMYPPNPTGMHDIEEGAYEFVFKSEDQTANSVHVFLDLPPGEEPVLDAGNKASWWDRDVFRFAFSDLPNGQHTITVFAFEETGNRSRTTWTIGIGAQKAGDEDYSGRVTLGELNSVLLGFRGLGPIPPSADTDDSNSISVSELNQVIVNYRGTP